MKVRLPVMVKDTMHAAYLGVQLTENWEITDEEFFLDGPVTRRVAIIDFDETTGEVSTPVRFNPPAPGAKIGRYDVPEQVTTLAEVLDTKFIRVCALSAVLRTIKMFEDEDALGRPVTWAFDHPQLLVVARAGRWENAFYERDSRSLQFFYFTSAAPPYETIYTCLSNDVVAHETGHAILDGVAPDLYNATTPQSLALHEAIADLVAVVMAFRSNKLRLAALKQTGGNIHDSRAFAGIAEQFQLAMSPFGEKHFLRELLNDKSLDPNLPAGDPNRVRRDEPHALSEVLSGALYRVMMEIYQQRWDKAVAEELKQRREKGEQITPDIEAKVKFSTSGKSLALAAEHFKRMIFRALDYLPPGEVSFADYGRAILAADQASHPEQSTGRDRLRAEFLRRGIVADAKSLDVQTNYREPAVENLDLQRLVESDWAAYEFADTHRAFLGIPEGIHFRVRPRLMTSKSIYRGRHTGTKTAQAHECILKVSWDHKEPSPIGRGFPAERQITVGTTLVIDKETRKIRAKLTSDYALPEQLADRDALLRQLADNGVLCVGAAAIGPDGKVLNSAIAAEVMDGLMRVRGTARMLHICGGDRS